MNELIWVGNTLYPRWIVLATGTIIIIGIVNLTGVLLMLASKRRKEINRQS